MNELKVAFDLIGEPLETFLTSSDIWIPTTDGTIDRVNILHRYLLVSHMMKKVTLRTILKTC